VAVLAHSLMKNKILSREIWRAPMRRRFESVDTNRVLVEWSGKTGTCESLGLGGRKTHCFLSRGDQDRSLNGKTASEKDLVKIEIPFHYHRNNANIGGGAMPSWITAFGLMDFF
jgi:hypothetical protein